MNTSTIINRAAIVRLYPNREQAAVLRRWQGGLRFVWNETLNWCKTQREKSGKWPNRAAIQTHMVSMKKQSETEWVGGIPAHAILAIARDMHRAFRNWFEKRARMPRFRGKRQRQLSVYMASQKTKLGKSQVKLPKLGSVRFRAGSLPEGRLVSLRVFCQADKWFMSITFECERFYSDHGSVDRVGIDMGIKVLATAFDGQKVMSIENPKALEKHLVRLRRYQRRVSRRIVGSKRRENAQRCVARLHQRIANARKDAAHKATSMLIKHANTIVIESLNVRGMVKNRHLARAVSDASIGMFMEMLRYKAAWYGRSIIEASQWFPSSKTCSACGVIHDMPLSVRRMSCVCGNEMDRDENAARNLFAYREELGNAGRATPKKRVESGDQNSAEMLGSVPVDETRMLKQTHVTA